MCVKLIEKHKKYFKTFKRLTDNNWCINWCKNQLIIPNEKFDM